MPRTVKKYKIFVASPSDVIDERESIVEVIKELNITYGNSKSITIELLRWETHSAPAANLYGIQDIINNDIGDDYDLFIGILWTKFGTPTTKEDSGTVEEFKLAYDRYQKSPHSSRILFYFKTSTPDSLDKIDPAAYQKVIEFKSSLGNLAVLYWNFRTIAELQSYLRIHIARRIDQLELAQHTTTVLEKLPFDISMNNIPDEELGILDYQDNIIEDMSNSKNSLERITDSLNWISGKLNEKTDELNKLKASKKEIGVKELRNIFHRTADDMNDFAKRIELEIPIYYKSFESALNSLSQIINLMDEPNEDLLSAYKSNDSLIDAISSSINGMDEFFNAVITFPRIEKELNKARRNVEEKISAFIQKLIISKQLAYELKNKIEEKYDL